MAKKDGVITEEEKQIIDQVHIDLRVYDEAHEKAIEDNIITENESRHLTELRDLILSNANAAAISDSLLNKNESDLIVKLSKVLKRYLD